MKLKAGRYHNQWGLGISYMHTNNVENNQVIGIMYRSFVLELVFFYIEWVITDYPDEF